MKTIDRNRYDMLDRVRQFGAKHGDLFPGDSLGGQTFAALAAAVGQIGQNATSHAQGWGVTRSGSLSKADARQALYAALEKIATTARAMAPDLKGLQGKFELPNRKNDLDLVTTAQQFAADAAPLAAQFVAHRLPATFIADLQSATNVFMQAAEARVAGRMARASSREGISGAFDAAFAALKRLDAIVPNALSSQPTVLAEWNSVRRVERARTAGHPASGPTPSATPVPQGGTPQAATPAPSSSTPASTSHA